VTKHIITQNLNESYKNQNSTSVTGKMKSITHWLQTRQ